jgi:hypothetical protein
LDPQHWKRVIADSGGDKCISSVADPIRIQIRIRIHMFLGLPDPDPDPIADVWIRIRILLWIRIRILLSLCKNSKKILDSCNFVTILYFLSLNNDVNVASKSFLLAS